MSGQQSKQLRKRNFSTTNISEHAIREKREKKRKEVQDISEENIQNRDQQKGIAEQIQSENIYVKNKQQRGIDRKGIVQMLIVFELQKMGFMKNQYDRLVHQLIANQDLQDVEVKNLRQWVTSKKSVIVSNILSNNENLYFQDGLSEMKKSHKAYKSEDQGSEKEKQKYSNSNSLPGQSFFIPYRVNSTVVNTKPIRIRGQKKRQIYSERQSNSESASSPSSSYYIQEMQNNYKNTQEPQIKNRQVKRQQIQQILCPICLVETTDYIQLQCIHRFCRICTRDYLIQNMNMGNYILQCPQVDCNAQMTEQVAKGVLDENVLSRFVKFRQKSRLQNNPNNKFCSRPDCGQVLIQNNLNKFQCKKCNIVFCTTCQEVDHPGKDCQQVITNQINQVFENYKIKKCPSCSAPIQKMQGCNHMTCKKCKYEFCWICLQKYTIYHYRIYNCCGCPGLQFEQPQQSNFKRFLQFVFFITLPLIISLSLTAIVVGLPVFMIFDFFTKPCKWISDYDTKIEMQLLNCICCCLPQCLIVFFTYFVMLPRSALACIFISPIQYFQIIINILCNIV